MKTILITGSTDGIGKLTAEKLALKGHRLILHGRNAEKLKNTIAELKSLTKNDLITGYKADFSELSEVKKMAETIRNDHSTIDVLINNAGVFKSPVTPRSLDLRVVVNYLAPYLLTQLILPVLQKNQGTRIINLSSAAQQSVDLTFLTGKQHVNVQQAYAQSKLALTMWSFHLAKKLPSTTVIAVNPGSLLNTKMVQEAYGQFWASAEKGAAILENLALSPNHQTNSGKYFDNDQGQYGTAHPDAYESEKVNALINTTQHLIEEICPL